MSDRSIQAVIDRLYSGESDGDDHDIAADYIMALWTAAGKVTCGRCSGKGFVLYQPEAASSRSYEKPCPACTDLRERLGEKP